MTRFEPTDEGVVSRDLLQLQQQLGGEVGVLRAGTISHKEVLKLGPGTYVTATPPPKGLLLSLTVSKEDLHVVRTAADATYFAGRYRNFKGALGGA